MAFTRFLFDATREAVTGSRAYLLYLLALLAVALLGAWSYGIQLTEGLVVTGMSDQVSWGFYIANFAFLVGIAAAAVLLVIPTYVFYRKDFREVVLLGEMMAVAAVLMAMAFVVVDLGRPERFWHMIPLLGRFNWPQSLLAWDVVVLNGYLVLNVVVPCYLLFSRYRGTEPRHNVYYPIIVIAIFWAISIHTVTAFLFSANAGRPFWHNALIAPRFIASAFASGPALIILAFQVVGRITGADIKDSVIRTLGVIMTVALQVNLFFVLAELFTDFYSETGHAASMRYLFFGLHGATGLVPWIWGALAMNLLALAILMIRPLRHRRLLFNIACVLVFAGVWIEKGMGFVIPGFIPTPLGEVFEYTPTAIELGVAAGIWAAGIALFSMLAKVVLAVQAGRLAVSAPATTTAAAGEPEPTR